MGEYNWEVYNMKKCIICKKKLKQNQKIIKLESKKLQEVSNG